MENRDGFIPKDDIEFERELRQREAEEAAMREKLEAERREAEEKARAEYEKTLQDRKIELIKLKQGVIESSDVIKEVHEEKPKLTLSQKLSGMWYRSKWLIIFAAAMVFAFAYIIYDTATAEHPDFTVLAISSDTGLYYRSVELEEFMESYAYDANGDGEVSVLIYNITTDYGDPNTATSAQAQIMSQLQSGENVIIISDESTDFLMTDFREDYPDSDRFTENGLLLNCALTREKLKWEAMPDNLYIGVRSAARLLSTSKDEMQEEIDKAMPVFEKIVEDVLASEK